MHTMYAYTTQGYSTYICLNVSFVWLQVKYTSTDCQGTKLLIDNWG